MDISVLVTIRLPIYRPSRLECSEALDFRFGQQNGMAKFMRNNTTQKQLSSHPEWLNDWQKRIKALKNLPSLFGMVWAAAPIVVVSSLVCRLLAALVPLGILAVTRLIIDSIFRLTSNHTPLPGSFWWMVSLEFALASVAMITSRLIDFCDSRLADKFTCYINVRIMQHATSLDLVSYEDPLFYDKLERARVQGTDRIGMIQATGRLVQEFFTTVSLAASIFIFSPLILFTLIVCTLPTFLSETHFAFLGYALSSQQTPARREMEYFRVLGGSKESAKELRLFGLGSFLVDRYQALANEVHHQTFGLARRRLFIGLSFALLGTIGYYGSYAFAIHQTVIGVLSLGTLTLLAGAIAGTNSNIQAVLGTFSSIAGQALFLTDLLEFFSVKPKVFSKPGAMLIPRPIRRGFEFKNVSFSYPGSSKKVLNNINFRLEPGERIALVGKNGQGKTTIVKLLTRLYEPTAGQILLDGVDIRDYNLQDLWKEIGVIFQDFMRYELPCYENIAMGRIEDRKNSSRIRAAAHKSLADEVIQKLPHHYNQRLGCRFEGGVDLSGGEWQKIALARAYLRDSQLLILDEPTASLDARSEHEVFERFSELTEGKMALLISHRLSTVRMADRILVLENGSIAEEGPHEQLIKIGGGYAEMFELQAASYR
jgi:ATP-binding cassette, subfamily B, bacterial